MTEGVTEGWVGGWGPVPCHYGAYHYGGTRMKHFTINQLDPGSLY